MYKKVLISLSFLLLGHFVMAQKIYNPKANAKSDIQKAVQIAKASNKHVLLQIGGNWCPWCVKLHKYFEQNKEVKEALEKAYVFVEVNYSKENPNMDIMKSLGYPQRFGFPVLVVLDAEGNRLHTQNSAYLEKDKSYDDKKVIGFLQNWRPDALKDENYNK